MEAPTILPPEADPLELFCIKVLSENEANWPPEEKMLADAFASHFSVPLIFDLDTFIQFCKPLGIEVSSQTIPLELRGYNSVYKNRKIILVSDEQDFPTADLHTAFHELREIIEYVFCRFSKPTAIGPLLEVRAEDFATALRMGRTLKIGKMLADSAHNIEHKWKRRGAYVLIFAVTLVYGLMDVLVPHFEKVNRDNNRKS